MKYKRIQIVHIIMLIIGTIFLMSGAFHSSIWFDESYTVGLIHHNMVDLCRIATYDVHPHLYYILLKLFSYIFGTSIISMRLFSVLGATLLALLGYTHIRKDFGDKAGLWFTFFVLFIPSTFKYALQIRMYTWAPLLVTVTAIYAYRMIVDSQNKRKNTVIFVVFSIMTAYSHYYALMAVAIMNMILLVYYINKKYNLKKWFLMAIVQLGLFIPGLYVFVVQMRSGGASWIKVKYPDIIFDTITFHFLGVPQSDLSITSPIYIITLCIGICIYLLFGYLLVQMIRNRKEDTKPAFLAIAVYFGVIIVFSLISIYRPIYYVRYSIVSYGLLLFAFAYIFAHFHKVSVKLMIAVVMIGLSIVRAIPIYQDNYAASNHRMDDFLEANIQNGDIILFDNISAFSVSVKFQDVPIYFYNVGGWDVEEAYRAFGKNIVISRKLEEIKDFKGRIWILGKGSAYQSIMKDSGSKEILTENIKFEYYGDENGLDIILIEKR